MVLLLVGDIVLESVVVLLVAEVVSLPDCLFANWTIDVASSGSFA